MEIDFLKIAHRVV